MILFEQEHKVKITPYSETASEASNVDIQKQRVDSRRLDEHSPIIIVPEETTTAEPEPVYIIQIEYYFVTYYKFTPCSGDVISVPTNQQTMTVAANQSNVNKQGANLK